MTFPTTTGARPARARWRSRRPQSRAGHTQRRSHAAPPADLRTHVEGVHRGRVLVLAPRLARDHPHDLELVAVRVDAVDALGRAMARFTGVGAGLHEGLASLLQLVDRVDLPGEVVQPDGAPRSGWCVGP